MLLCVTNLKFLPWKIAGSKGAPGWMLISGGCFRSRPTSSIKSVGQLAPVLPSSTDLCCKSSLAIWCHRCSQTRVYKPLEFLCDCILFSEPYKESVFTLEWKRQIMLVWLIFGRSDVLEHDEDCSDFANPGCDMSVSFFRNLMRMPSFDSASISSLSQILIKRVCSILMLVSGSALVDSADISSVLAAFQFFSDMVAFHLLAWIFIGANNNNIRKLK